jgi:PAS domain S-box-containing protein
MATILIIDDLAANREFLAAVLRHEGHRLLEAADGGEGLAAAQAEHPDLVITDVLMPVMDGYELLRRLRLDPATRDVPVVFYTAHYAEREARALALAGGVAHVLTKPALTETVLEIVGKALSGAAETETPSGPAALPARFAQEHLRLLTDKLSEKTGDLRAANARLRALINIGLDLASEREPVRLLEGVCNDARELFAATYVTLGILDRDNGTLQRLFTSAGAGIGISAGDPAPGILGTVIAERRTMRGENPRGDPTALGLPALHPEIRAFLAAPVASPAQVYGWICLVGNQARAYTEEDHHHELPHSGQVGRIYENGYFYSIARNRAEELAREIFERQQAELALRRERDRAQQYLDTAEVILLALDMSGRMTLVNRYGCNVLGWTAEELRGRKWIETCIPARDRDVMLGKFDALVRGEFPLGQNPVLLRSGEERLIEWRNTRLLDDAGRVVGTLSCGTDITDRDRAAEALRAAEERTRFALEAAGVGIWSMDCITGAVEWSKTLEIHYGMEPGSFGGTYEAFLAAVHPDDRAAVVETVGKAMKAGSDYSVLNRSVWPDGSVRWLSGAGRVLLGEGGQAVRAVGISQDITERRGLEEQYLQAQKMEAVGRLAGGVAHDFNNLLTAILGYCELLLADGEPGDQRRADILEIQKAGLSAAGLTRQLLAFSRKEIIEPKLLDLNQVVTGLRAMLGRLIGEDVIIQLALRPGVAHVWADPGQVEQIVLNLAINSRDAMPRGGRLTIETADVAIDEDYAKAHLGAKPGRYVALTVTDTGTGMTPETKARLFEPFFTTKEIGKGTGLGLATVHGIVARSGGSVNVYSEVGLGTSFKVYFPRAGSAEAAVEAPSPVLRRHSGASTVLIVEDEDGLRRLTKRLLEGLGYTVLAAADAGEALELLESNPAIELLLTDVVMPGTSGPELARRLIARRPGLKVMYMSGYTEETVVHHGVIDAGIAFLHKPFTAEALGRKLSETLGEPAESVAGQSPPDNRLRIA